MYSYSKATIQAIHNTWQAIGSDVLDCCGDDLDNEGAVECCMDAGRIVMYGGDGGHAAQDEFLARFKVLGYGKALTELAKALPYPLM